MISLINKWRWGGDPDLPDPVSGLTLRDIYVIERTWAPVYAHAEQNGVELFKRLFSSDPETRSFFKIIRDVSDDQLGISPQFRAHAINLMSAFHIAILNLRHPDVVAAMMHKLGDSHERRHITQKHFEVMMEVLENYVRNDLCLKANQIGSWKMLLKFMFSQIFTRLASTE